MMMSPFLLYPSTRFDKLCHASRRNCVAKSSSLEVPNVNVAEVELVRQTSKNSTTTNYASSVSSWKDICEPRMLVWTGLGNAFLRGDGCCQGWRIGFRRFLSVTVTTAVGTDDSTRTLFVWADSIEAASYATGILMALITGSSNASDITAIHWKSMACTPLAFSAPTSLLADLLKQESKTPFVLTLDSFILTADLCQALATTMTSSSTVVELVQCRLEEDASRSWADSLIAQPQKGCTFWIHACSMNCRNLATAVESNRIDSLKVHGHQWQSDASFWSDRDLGVVLAGLGTNTSLRSLDMSSQPISDSNWRLLMYSLQDHPTLKVLNAKDTQHWKVSSTSAANCHEIVQLSAVAHILRVNTVLQTVALSPVKNSEDQAFYQYKIRPQLRCNRYSYWLPQQQRLPSSLRPQMVGRTLASASDDTNLLWFWLSNNIDVVVASTRSENG